MYFNNKIYLNSNSSISSQKRKLKNLLNYKNDNTINIIKLIINNSENIDSKEFFSFFL